MGSVDGAPAAAPGPGPAADRTGSDFFGHFLRAYPRRTVLMVALLILAGLAEGIGLVTLLPLLEVASGESGGAGSSITAAITGALRAVGIAPTFEVLLLLIVVMMCLKGAFLWLAMRQVGYTVAQVETDMRLQLIRALMSAEWSYFVRHPTGHFTNSISSEAHRATSAYRQGCSALASLVQVVVFSVVVFLVSWKIALAAFAVGAALVYALRGFIRMSRAAGSTQTRVMKSLVARLTEAVPGIKPIKAMARESQLLPLLEEETEGYRDAQRQNVLAVETRRAFQEPLLVIVIAAGLWVLVGIGSQPIAAILVLAAIFYRLMQTLNQLQSQYQDMVLNESALWSMRQQIDQAEAAREVLHGTTPPPRLEQGIRFENVSFSHPGTRVFSDLSLDLPAGRLITVTGPSGAGKTTLIDLAVGLLRPGRGRVLVDGVPLDTIDARAWRRAVGYVPQEIVLFHGSIRRNVSLGDPTLSREAVVEALQRAGAWDFVSRLPLGIEAAVGERGAQLSGGQRQRIAIARALVSRPRLLVLDEGTAALDPETERGICATLRALRGAVTILAISHQPAMNAAADLVVRVSPAGVTVHGTADPAPPRRAQP